MKSLHCSILFMPVLYLLSVVMLNAQSVQVHVEIRGKDTSLYPLVEYFDVCLVDKNSNDLAPDLVFPDKRIKAKEVSSGHSYDFVFSNFKPGEYFVKMSDLSAGLAQKTTYYSKLITVKADSKIELKCVLPLNFVEVDFSITQEIHDLLADANATGSVRMHLYGFKNDLEMNSLFSKTSDQSLRYQARFPMLADGNYIIYMEIGRRESESVVVKVQDGKVLGETAKFNRMLDFYQRAE